MAAIGLAFVGWVIPIAAWLAARDTGGTGIFRQERVGLNGTPFEVMKLRTMRIDDQIATTVTTSRDARITPLGRALRRTKLDELPQLINVLHGDMSLVGPRPDVAGYYDALEGDDRVLLMVRPGITSPASVKFRSEEAMLATTDDPEAFNLQVIFPQKVAMNREWLATWSLRADIACLWRTLFQRGPDASHEIW